jgi:3',5'-cyclic-AMP phosphodiesterase
MEEKRMPHVKSVETKYYEERDAFFQRLQKLDRRSFLKVAVAAAGGALTAGVSHHFHSFQPVEVAFGAEGGGEEQGFTFAYLSDAHLYSKKTNDRFVNQILRAVYDINNMNPQPDFVIFGGDLAQLGQPGELQMGAQILKAIKAPLKVMVGEHDWFYDLGEKWQELFGKPTYSFDHKGVHFVVLQSVYEDDFWTARRMSPLERMQTVAGLDNKIQSRFQVGEAQREWLKNDLARYSPQTPLIVFSHSPLYKYYRPWNFWTEDAEEVQAILRPFERVTVVHGHTHQMLMNRIGNINFYGMLSTAWPWPYAPEGLPKLTVQMARANPFDRNDALGDGMVTVPPGGMADAVYQFWNRNPVQVKASYLTSSGQADRPAAPNLVSY